MKVETLSLWTAGRSLICILKILIFYSPTRQREII